MTTIGVPMMRLPPGSRSGRRRIGLVSGPLKVSNAKERWRGFRDALEERNLPFDPEFVVEGDYPSSRDSEPAHALLSHRPDGSTLQTT